ncbi:hypothetical protein QAD02_001481 [Eretmocerus hayati]|uniref:Uncharacterized protein n=1 Tax=Eretmocerus hayati TaxID=131215 RepID=A0ACC2NGJ8_9HYME|nr:hypothetical protein QAD02_001481 [Eretmocerus hayati]
MSVAPAPPPPLPLLLQRSAATEKAEDVEERKFSSSTPQEEIDRLILHNRLCESKILFHHDLQPILQDGPQCGLVALSMASQCKDGSVSVEQLFQTARDCGFTRHGELFSVDFMETLSKKHLQRYHSEIVENLKHDPNSLFQLLSCGILVLIPYDSDFNHAPCLKRGHKAHWAVLVGLISSRQGPYVLARHGKSKHVGCWPMRDLLESNANLEEENPHRNKQGFIIPEGGVGGKRGLKSRALALRTIE